MKDYVYIDEVPSEEQSAQVSSTNYYYLAMIEISTHKHQLIRQWGMPPAGSFFRTHPNPHDAGTFYTLNYIFDDENESHVAYAYLMENCATNWDSEALIELIGIDPHYFELVKESNVFKSPRLNTFLQEVMKIINS